MNRYFGGMQAVSKGWMGALVVLCLACSGCTREEVNGDTITYGFEMWVGLVAALGGVILVVLGVLGFMAKGIDWLRRAALGLCAFGAFALAYSVEAFTEQVVIAADHATVTEATLCFGSTEHKLVFADMMTLDETEEERSGRRGRKNKVTVFIARMRSGEEIRMDTSPVLRHALHTLVYTAGEAGVPIGSALASHVGYFKIPDVAGLNRDTGFGAPRNDFGFAGERNKTP